MSEGKGKRKRETERVRDSDITSKAPSQLFFCFRLKVRSVLVTARLVEGGVIKCSSHRERGGTAI